MSTEKLLAEIKEACAKATPAPWRACAWDPMERPHVHKDSPEQLRCHVGKDLPITGHDAHFIANARTWLPKLVEIVREQQKQLEETRGDLVSLLEAPVCLDPACNDERCVAYRKYLEVKP